MTQAEHSEVLESVRDVSDFCLKWSALRSGLGNLEGVLDHDQVGTVKWLMKLADKVCVDEVAD